MHAVGADAHIGPFPISWFDTPKLKPIGAKIRKILLIKVKFHRRADVGIGPYDGKRCDKLKFVMIPLKKRS